MNRKVLIILTLASFLMTVSKYVHADSLWSGTVLRESSYFSEMAKSPVNVHDIIFILIDESTIANAEVESEFEQETTVDGEVTAWFTLDGLKNIFFDFFRGETADIKGRADGNADLPEWGISITNEYEGEAETERIHTLRTKIAATVLDILPNGNLIIEAKRFVRINGETLQILMTGIARPGDIDAENQIESSKIAELNVKVFGKGDASRVNKQGLITRALGYLT